MKTEIFSLRNIDEKYGFCKIFIRLKILRFFINTAAHLYVKVKSTRMTRDQEDKADKFVTFVPQII